MRLSSDRAQPTFLILHCPALSRDCCRVRSSHRRESIEHATQEQSDTCAELRRRLRLRLACRTESESRLAAQYLERTSSHSTETIPFATSRCRCSCASTDPATSTTESNPRRRWSADALAKKRLHSSRAKERHPRRCPYASENFCSRYRRRTHWGQLRSRHPPDPPSR